MEDKGIRVYLVEGHSDFDACTVWVQDMPVIVIKRDILGDGQRFNWTHELGHLVLETPTGVNEERAANRFAGAFLVPASVVKDELGTFRNSLHLHELYLLKLKYGLSMQGWIDRANDCKIISQSEARNLYHEFRMNEYHSREPGQQLPAEESKRMYRLVMKAVAEGMISEMRAAELLKVPLREILRLGEGV